MNTLENKEPLQLVAPQYTLLQPSRYGWHVCMINDMQSMGVMFQGDVCPVEADLLCSFLNPGDAVIDVGASVGSFALAFASAVAPTGKVFAMEPQGLPYQCLVANTVINSLSHIIFPFQVAVGEAPGEIGVPVLNPRNPNHGGCSLIGEAGDAKIPTTLITIDSMRVPSCRLIKVDVEGMEPQVLKGAYETIAKFRPILWVEHLNYAQTEGLRADTKADLIAIFDEHDYEARKIQTPSFSPANIRRQRTNPFGDWVGDQNVLAVPRGQPFPEAPAYATKWEPFQ
jgi:FkbM family methyltransferase